MPATAPSDVTLPRVEPLALPRATRYDAAMAEIKSLFVTPFYRARLSEHGSAVDTAELDAECRAIAEDDEAGQRWSEENDYPGYTS